MPPHPKDRHATPNHDVLMKELISALLQPFVQAFLPQIHPHIDWAQTRKATSEFAIGRTTVTGDVVFESSIVGEPARILIHVESQAQRQESFPYRMLLYTASMAREGKRVLPIAICTYDSPKGGPPVGSTADDATVDIAFPFGSVLSYRFYRLDLRAGNWRDYLAQAENPAVAALLSRMRYSPEERPEVLRAFARGILGLSKVAETSAAAAELVSLVTTYFGSYFEITDEEGLRALADMRINAPQEELVYLNMVQRYKDVGRQEGIMEGHVAGRQEGLIEGARQMLMQYLTARFGNVPAEIAEALDAVLEPQAIEPLSAAIYRAADLAAVARILRSERAAGSDASDPPQEH